MTATSVSTPAAPSRSSRPLNRLLLTPANGQRKRHNRREELSCATYYIVGTLLAMLFLAPVLYILLRSFLPASADADGISWQSLTHLTSTNYARIFDESVGITTFVRNSAVVAVSVALGTGLVAMLAGYSLSRIRFRFSTGIFILLLAPMVVPYQGLLTPLSIVLGKIGLLDSLAGVILVLITLQLPFSVFVMRNTLDGIPVELEEAAQLDGAGTGRLLRSVMLPLAWPGMVTVCLFGFMAGWNDLLSSVVFLSTDTKYTLPLALTNITTSFKIPGVQIVDPGLLTATACVATIPVVVLFLALQRYYTKGLIGGAIK